MPFVVKNNKGLFLIKNQEVYYFVSSIHIKMQIGLNYFKISYVKNTFIPFCLTKHGRVIKYVLLVIKYKESDYYY